MCWQHGWVPYLRSSVWRWTLSTEFRREREDRRNFDTPEHDLYSGSQSTGDKYIATGCSSAWDGPGWLSCSRGRSTRSTSPTFQAWNVFLSSGRRSSPFSRRSCVCPAGAPARGHTAGLGVRVTESNLHRSYSSPDPRRPRDHVVIGTEWSGTGFQFGRTRTALVD